MIEIAKGLKLPVDTVTQTVGILAKRRSGKSYCARRFAEQLHHAKQQIVIVDPKGDWWGIRSSADGKRPGLPIVILGGERGDAPLEPQGGEIVAKLVVEERVSVLLDLSPLRKRELATFCTSFLENLYRLKAQEIYRTPMMLIVDEADAIAPQKPQSGEERMLGAIEDIVRRGGQRGIGCTMISQRSAVLNKNVLTQIQLLITLRTMSPQDLKAIEAWVDVHGTKAERDTLMESLPSLPIGDAWFWSPGWPTDVGIFQREHVLPIETFDSGATPKPGAKRVEPKQLADVDLGAINRQMADVVARHKADDPKELRKRIAELEKQKAPKPAAAAPQPASDRELRLAVAARDKEWKGRFDQLQRAHHQLTARLAKIHEQTAPFTESITFAAPEPLTAGDATEPRPPALSPKPPVNRQPVAVTPAGDLTNSQQRILSTVAMLNVRGLEANRERVARWMDIHPNGGRYGSDLGRLRADGYLDGFLLTEVGRAIADVGETGLAGALAALPDDSMRRTLQTIVDARRPLSREELAELLGIHPNGGRYGSTLGRLRTLGVITERGPIAATAELFQ